MNCDETFSAGICYVTDAYKRVCGFNEELHADLEKCRSENAKLRELVRDVHALATDHGVDVRYPYCDAWDEKLAVVEEQMRELGIEADE